MTLLSPPADTLVPAWQWFLATWFGAGLVEPLRAGLAVATAGVVVLILSRRHALALPLSGLLILLLGVFVSTMIGEASGMRDDRRIVIDEVAAFVLGAAFLRSFHWTVLLVFGSVFLYLDGRAAAAQFQGSYALEHVYPLIRNRISELHSSPRSRPEGNSAMQR